MFNGTQIGNRGVQLLSPAPGFVPDPTRKSEGNKSLVDANVRFQN